MSVYRKASQRIVAVALAQPVYRVLMFGLIVIALVPVGFLGFRLYHLAWDDAWREINEKHRLLAMNLASPIQIYVKDRLAMLDLLANEIGNVPATRANRGAGQRLINAAFSRMKGFRSIVLLDRRGRTRILAHGGMNPALKDISFTDESCFVKTRATGKWAISNVKRSLIDGAPTVLLSQPVRGPANTVSAVLIGELDMAPIEALRRNIHFGKRGHSAIVDKTGHIVAHPNPEWMREIRDVSTWPVVRKMMAGKTGVTEFYSPFVGAQMVAGFATVPEFGWGVMVPQPKSEVRDKVYGLLFAQFRWALVGLGLAIMLAILLVRWITRPTNRLAVSAQRLTNNDFEGDPPVVPAYAPREIRQLGAALRDLVSGFQASRAHVNELNRLLQSRVEEATSKLREANARLEEQVRSDYLTSLPNRRYFEHALRSVLNRRSTDTEPLCIMSIDIDNFKDINDRHGHAAGDMVLTEVAAVLRTAIRPTDLVARYGGDEFVAQLRCPLIAGCERASEIRSAIEQHSFTWRGSRIRVTVSIGVLEFKTGAAVDMESILHHVDHAMYEAKRRGRNTVAETVC